jgi:hypothetical protein
MPPIPILVKRNLFTPFEEDVNDADTTEQTTTNIVKKALKKLREIDALKQKQFHTPEEVEKINTESYWQSFLEPLTAEQKPKETEERKFKQYMRHLEKESKKEKKQKKEAAAKKAKEEAEAREREEYAKEYEKTQLLKNPNYLLEKQLETEFHDEIADCDSPCRAFRKLSLKYHPDKHPTEKSKYENIQKLLGTIRDDYVNNEP